MSNRDDFLYNTYCVDFESTALEHDKAEIIEQGISAYAGKWVILHSSLHNAENGIPPEASSVNNITIDMVNHLPQFTFDQFIGGHGVKLCARDDTIFISHNAPYDSGILEKYISSAATYNKIKENWLCSLRMTRKLHANDTSFTYFNLSYLRYRLGFKVDVKTEPHRAGYDSYLNGLLVEYIITELEDRELIDVNKPYLPQIKEWLKEPIIIELMPFGKYAGMPLVDLPESYMHWGLDTMDKLKAGTDEYDPDLAISWVMAMDANEYKV